MKSDTAELQEEAEVVKSDTAELQEAEVVNDTAELQEEVEVVKLDTAAQHEVGLAKTDRATGLLSPEQSADAVEQWYENAARDACNRIPDITLDQARIFVRHAFTYTLERT